MSVPVGKGGRKRRSAAPDWSSSRRRGSASTDDEEDFIMDEEEEEYQLQQAIQQSRSDHRRARSNDPMDSSSESSAAPVSSASPANDSAEPSNTKFFLSTKNTSSGKLTLLRRPPSVSPSKPESALVPSPSPSPSIVPSVRSARQAARREAEPVKKYQEVDSDYDDYDSDKEEGDEERPKKPEASTKKNRSTPAGNNADIPAVTQATNVYLDLSSCLGRSQIERILARKLLPAPSTQFLSIFLRKMDKATAAYVHPQDLENFWPEAFAEYEKQRKEKEEEAMRQEEKRKLREEEQKKRENPTALPQFSTYSPFSNSSAVPTAAPSLTHSNSFSLTAMATSGSDLTSSTSNTHAASKIPKPTAQQLEYHYLIKWKERSYSPLALNWIPQSLLMLFHDGPQRIRRYERTREYGESAKSVARISKSDEELEMDEENTREMAMEIQSKTLDQRKMRSKVEEKEASIVRAQDSLKPTNNTLMSKLIASKQKLEHSADGSQTSVANNAVNGIDGDQEMKDASESTAPVGDSDPTSTMSKEELLELEEQLENQRIARRLADISNDHKLARFKRIRTGFFDPDYATVERIIAHRRRRQSMHHKRVFQYITPDTKADHWNYFGIKGLNAIKDIQDALASYIAQIDSQTKSFIVNLAETIDPRLRLQREARQQMANGSETDTSQNSFKMDVVRNSPQKPPKPAEPEAEAEAEAARKEELPPSISPPVARQNSHTLFVEDKYVDEQKDESLSRARSLERSQPIEEAKLESNETVKEDTPQQPSRGKVDPDAMDTSSDQPRAELAIPPSALHVPSPSPSAPSVNSATTETGETSISTTGRPRRSNAKRPRYLVEDGAIDSDEEEQLRLVLNASKLDAHKDGAVANKKQRVGGSKKKKVTKQQQETEDEEDAGSEFAFASKDMDVDNDNDEAASDLDEDDSDPFEFLVKWHKLPYDCCTWETRATLKRIDQFKQQQKQDNAIHTATVDPTNPSATVGAGVEELNLAVPTPSLASLPFIPLTSLLCRSNLMLKYLELPVVITDESHLSALGDAHELEEKAERAREKGEIAITHYKVPLHPTVPISSIIAKDKTESTVNTGGAQAPAAVSLSCVECLHRYLLLNCSNTTRASTVFPAASKSNNQMNLKAAPVTGDMKFGPDNKMSLRYYQVDGVNWMALNWAHGRNSILADEMGLGKTVQSSILMNYCITQQNFAHPILVVAPSSTVGFWQREIERFTSLYCITYRGSPENRKIIREYDWKWGTNASMDELNGLRKEEGLDVNDLPSHLRLQTNGKTQRREYRFNVMVTNYEFVINEFGVLSRIPFAALIVDEAQRLKNKDSKLMEKISQLKIPKKLLLTGTPIQNALDELWSLLHFIEPENFSSLDAFLAEFGEMNSVDQVTRLYHTLRPYVLRRLKADVEKSVPPKEEILIEIELTRVQKKYYKAVYEKNLKFLSSSVGKGDGKRTNTSLLNISMQLRKVCQHPYLIDGCEKDELRAMQDLHKKPLTSDSVMEKLVSCSGKFILLEKLLSKLKHEGHRVLIFSQMTKVLDILQDYLHYRRYKHERLDGNVGPVERQAAIDRFSVPHSDVFAFLLSTRAGGLGLTLTAADTVIIFDSDWNLQNDIQAMNRAHRIGQTKNVTVYRLLTKGTYEHEAFARACLKLTLDHVVMASMTQEVKSESALQAAKGNSISRTEVQKLKKGKKKADVDDDDTLGGTGASANTNATPFDKNEIEHMLKNGAYNIFGSAREEENTINSIQFAEEDITKILKRSQVMKYATDKDTGEALSAELATTSIEEQKADASFPSSTAPPNAESSNPSKSSVSSFSKASFVPKDGSEELSMSDPLFWEKMGMIDRSEKDPSSEGTVLDFKRVRKPVQTYSSSMDDEAPASTERTDVLGRKSREGPARCQICQMITREDEVTPILICDMCDEEAHLTCLGLHSIPVEDTWACPACVKAKRTTRVKSAADADEEADYQPDTMNGNGAPFKKREFAPSIRAGASKISLSKEEQYARLIFTYRTTHSHLNESSRKELADALWRKVFNSAPPGEKQEEDENSAVTNSHHVPVSGPRSPNACGNRTCPKIDGQDGTFLVCGRCLVSKYCGKECQLKAWKCGHKRECAAPKVTNPMPSVRDSGTSTAAECKASA